MGGNFTQKQHKAGLDRRLTGDTRHRVLLKHGINHRVADLVTHLIRVTFGDRFARKEQTR